MKALCQTGVQAVAAGWTRGARLTWGNQLMAGRRRSAGSQRVWRAAATNLAGSRAGKRREGAEKFGFGRSVVYASETGESMAGWMPWAEGIWQGEGVGGSLNSGWTRQRTGWGGMGGCMLAYVNWVGWLVGGSAVARSVVIIVSVTPAA
jgi:hypothetical protein